MQEDLVAQRLREMMRESGAHLEGHFRLTSGFHSGDYIQCALLLRYPRHAEFAGRALADRVRRLSPETVASPAIGGIVIGHEVARALDLPFIFCERRDGAMTLSRFPMPVGKRVVVIEDVITTGVSSGEVGRLLEEGGAFWAGTGAIMDRSGGQSSLPHLPESLWQAVFPVWQPEDCPLCRQGLPVVKPGSRV